MQMFPSYAGVVLVLVLFFFPFNSVRENILHLTKQQQQQKKDEEEAAAKIKIQVLQ